MPTGASSSPMPWGSRDLSTQGASQVPVFCPCLPPRLPHLPLSVLPTCSSTCLSCPAADRTVNHCPPGRPCPFLTLLPHFDTIAVPCKPWADLPPPCLRTCASLSWSKGTACLALHKGTPLPSLGVSCLPAPYSSPWVSAPSLPPRCSGACPPHQRDCVASSSVLGWTCRPSSHLLQPVPAPQTTKFLPFRSWPSPSACVWEKPPLCPLPTAQVRPVQPSPFLEKSRPLNGLSSAPDPCWSSRPSGQLSCAQDDSTPPRLFSTLLTPCNIIGPASPLGQDLQVLPGTAGAARVLPFSLLWGFPSPLLCSGVDGPDQTPPGCTLDLTNPDPSRLGVSLCRPLLDRTTSTSPTVSSSPLTCGLEPCGLPTPVEHQPLRQPSSLNKKNGVPSDRKFCWLMALRLHHSMPMHPPRRYLFRLVRHFFGPDSH